MSRAAGWVIAVDEAFRTPNSMEGIVHVMHGMFRTMCVRTAATDEIMTIFCVEACARVNEYSHGS